MFIEMTTLFKADDIILTLYYTSLMYV